LVDILDLLLAQKVEAEIEFAAYLIEGGAGMLSPPGTARFSNRAAMLTPSP